MFVHYSAHCLNFIFNNCSDVLCKITIGIDLIRYLANKICLQEWVTFLL